jgi:hypothetical protein
MCNNESWLIYIHSWASVNDKIAWYFQSPSPLRAFCTLSLVNDIFSNGNILEYFRILLCCYLCVYCPIDIMSMKKITKKNSVTVDRKRTIPTERPPLVGEVNANLLRVEGIACSAQRIPTAFNLGFLDRSHYFFIQVAPQLSSRGWVGTVPDPLLLRKSGRAGNRTRNLLICSQKLWPLDHRGGLMSMKTFLCFGHTRTIPFFDVDSCLPLNDKRAPISEI